MSGNVAVLLRKAAHSLSTIEAIYQRDLDANTVSDDLLYEVRAVVQDCQSALDWTATAVRNRLAPRTGRSPYFPLVIDPAKFSEELDKQIKGLRLDHPEVAAAIRRHQPFHSDKHALGYIRKLARSNKHQDFTAQVRRETPQLTLRHGGAGIQLSGNARIVLRGRARLTLDGKTISPLSQPPVDPEIAVENAVSIDWRFLDPPVSVLSTLKAIYRLTAEAVDDIRSAAGM